MSEPNNASCLRLSEIMPEISHDSVNRFLNLFYTDVNGVCLPVNYRIYDKSLDKTKNDYFREILTEIINWGLKPQIVTGDS